MKTLSVLVENVLLASLLLGIASFGVVSNVVAESAGVAKSSGINATEDGEDADGDAGSDDTEDEAPGGEEED